MRALSVLNTVNIKAFGFAITRLKGIFAVQFEIVRNSSYEIKSKESRKY